MIPPKLSRKTISSKNKEDMILKEDRLLKYLEFKLKNRKTKRGVELKYGWIAKHLGMTYRQVRYLMDKFVAQGIIERWAYNSTITTTHCFYRWIHY